MICKCGSHRFYLIEEGVFHRECTKCGAKYYANPCLAEAVKVLRKGKEEMTCKCGGEKFTKRLVGDETITTCDDCGREVEDE